MKIMIIINDNIDNDIINDNDDEIIDE